MVNIVAKSATQTKTDTTKDNGLLSPAHADKQSLINFLRNEAAAGAATGSITEQMEKLSHKVGVNVDKQLVGNNGANRNQPLDIASRQALLQSAENVSQRKQLETYLGSNGNPGKLDDFIHQRQNTKMANLSQPLSRLIDKVSDGTISSNQGIINFLVHEAKASNPNLAKAAVSGSTIAINKLYKEADSLGRNLLGRDFGQIDLLSKDPKNTELVDSIKSKIEVRKQIGQLGAKDSPEEVKAILKEISVDPNFEKLTAIGVGLSKLGINYKEPKNQEVFAEADKTLRALYSDAHITPDFKLAVRSTLALANTFYLAKHDNAAADPKYCIDATERTFLAKPLVLSETDFNKQVNALNKGYDTAKLPNEKDAIATKVAALYYTKSLEGKEKAFAVNESYQALVGKIILDQYSSKDIPAQDRTGGHLCFFHWENQAGLAAEQFKQLASNKTLPTAIRAQLAIFGCDSGYGSKDQKAWVFSKEGQQALKGEELGALVQALILADKQNTKK